MFWLECASVRLCIGIVPAWYRHKSKLNASCSSIQIIFPPFSNSLSQRQQSSTQRQITVTLKCFNFSPPPHCLPLQKKRQVSFLISFHGPVAVEQVTQVSDYMVLHFESYRASSRRLAITLKRALGMEGRGRLELKKDCVFVMPRLIRLFALLWNGLRCASRVREDSTRWSGSGSGRLNGVGGWPTTGIKTSWSIALSWKQCCRSVAFEIFFKDFVLL